MKKEFTLTFVSNYMNHHQLPMSDELYRYLGKNYKFIQTELVEEERVKMGWAKDNSRPYIVHYYDNSLVASELIMNSDIVIFGGVDDESYIMPRLEAGKPVLRYCERIYKTGRWKFITPKGLKKKYHDHTRFRNKPVYLLCAGGFVAGDFRMIGAYPRKKYKWGYFPETREYDIEKLIAHKRELTEQNNGNVSILWVGRFIEWKHPEMAIQLAEALRKLDYRFHLVMVGGGYMEDELHRMVLNKNLEEYVEFAGVKTPAEVRKYMENSEIFVFTSDNQEGWGAVLNEAMNSGCACVVGNRIGAVPYLINNRTLTFTSKNIMLLCKRTEELLYNPELRKQVAVEAYTTIRDMWNSENAARCIMRMCEDIMNGKKPAYSTVGPGSKA